MSLSESIPELKWTASLRVAFPPTPSNRAKLPGDKILLPPSALEQLLAAAPTTSASSDVRSGPLTSTFDPFNPYTYAAERWARDQTRETYQQLPHPLTFRLVNPANGCVVYAGVREFSAEEDEIIISDWIRESLKIDQSQDASETNGHSEDLQMPDAEIPKEQGPRITIHAKQLPKGTFVKLRPLEAGYDAEDWKALLEQYLRDNFTTLTNGEVLTVPGGRGIGSSSEAFKFLVDGFKPEGDGICVVDTDLEVDIEALNEEQARETVKKLAEKAYRAPGTQNGSSSGGQIDLFQSQNGQILPGDYLDFLLPAWDRAQGIEIELSGVAEDDVVNLYVSPLAPRQRAKPREDEYIFSAVDGKYPKKVRIKPTNTELEDATEIQIAINAYLEPTSSKSQDPINFTISVNPFDLTTDITTLMPVDSAPPPNPDETRCKNCHQWIPSRTLILHENFCYRNNILCPHGCNQVFQKRSPEFTSHWHCPHDDSFGNTPLSQAAHNAHFHTPTSCPACTRNYVSLAALAAHRTSLCPGKLILCQFCHLQVPQEGDPDAPDAHAILSGLTPHELADGARTTECHLCGKIVRLRDMRTHLAHHELQKRSRPAPVVCRNVLCGRSVHGVTPAGDTRLAKDLNEVGLCARCFGPLYVAMHDPDGRALKRRIERRYLTQLLTGCGKAWCGNAFCRAGRRNLGLEEKGTSTKEALPMIKPELLGLDGMESGLHFCVDEISQKSRILGDMVAAEGVYAVEWCVGALEAAAGDVSGAREWLANWAPKKE